MTRSSERLIDLLVLVTLLLFAYVMRTPQPGLAGVIVAAAVQFWMAKNAQEKPLLSDIEVVAKILKERDEQGTDEAGN